MPGTTLGFGWGWGGLEVLSPVIAQCKCSTKASYLLFVHMLLCGHFLKKKDRITALKYR